MKGYPISFNIYAEDEKEASDARSAIIEFIDEHARAGHAVTGRKIAHAVRSIRDNQFVRGKIIEYLKN